MKKELSVEEEQLLSQYCEGENNEYLHEALCACWENNIDTAAGCCGGHPSEEAVRGKKLMD